MNSKQTAWHLVRNGSVPDSKIDMIAKNILKRYAYVNKYQRMTRSSKRQWFHDIASAACDTNHDRMKEFISQSMMCRPWYDCIKTSCVTTRTPESIDALLTSLIAIDLPGLSSDSGEKTQRHMSDR